MTDELLFDDEKIEVLQFVLILTAIDEQDDEGFQVLDEIVEYIVEQMDDEGLYQILVERV